MREAWRTVLTAVNLHFGWVFFCLLPIHFGVTQLVRVRDFACVEMVEGGFDIHRYMPSLRGQQSTQCSLSFGSSICINQINPPSASSSSSILPSLSPRLFLSLDIHMLYYVTLLCVWLGLGLKAGGGGGVVGRGV